MILVALCFVFAGGIEVGTFQAAHPDQVKIVNPSDVPSDGG